MTCPADPQHAFLGDIVEHPEDDTPRLVYADWLRDAEGGLNPSLFPEEADPGRRRANHHRGDFIHTQVELAGLDRAAAAAPLSAEQEARREALRQEEARLLPDQQSHWRELLEPLGVRRFRLERGFPEYVSLPAEAFLQNAEAIFKAAPVSSVRITGLDSDQVQALVACEQVCNLVKLDLSNNPIGNKGASHLARAPNFRNLTSLNLQHCLIEASGAELLAASPLLRKLVTLNLEDNYLRSEGVRFLAASPHLERLTELNLAENGIGQDGAEALAACQHLGNLRVLNLGLNRLGAEGVAELSGSRYLGGLTALNLAGNHIRDAGAQVLTATPTFQHLTELHLAGNHIGDAGAQALAGSPHLERLTALDLYGNHIGDAGAQALAGSPHLERLTELDLGATRLSGVMMQRINERWPLGQHSGQGMGGGRVR
jgi:uncharacterized protein (TIGR02996 family)